MENSNTENNVIQDIVSNREVMAISGSEKPFLFQILGKAGEDILKISENGDFFVKGKLVENDKEIVDAFKEFLSAQGLITK